MYVCMMYDVRSLAGYWAEMHRRVLAEIYRRVLAGVHRRVLAEIYRRVLAGVQRSGDTAPSCMVVQ
jgi:hypothetical protein